MERIVSLLPSLTETACALGLEDRLVGRSHECDYPSSVSELPVCTEAKFDPVGSSREIDDRVKALVRDGLSVYRVDTELLRCLAPDAILTQDQCEVCAVSLDDVEKAVGAWTGSAPRVLSVAPSTLGDVFDAMGRIARELGVSERGDTLVRELTDRVTGIGEKAGGLPGQPRVACIEWLDPLMGAGNWVPELVALAGGRGLFGVTGAHSDWLEWEALRTADPDVLVLLPCGFDLERTRAELHTLTKRSGWANLAAVRAGRVYLTDGNQYFNRPGPRLVESLEILAEILHPEIFHFGHEGSGWERL